MATRTITLADMQTEIADDLAWIDTHDDYLAMEWQAIINDNPPETPVHVATNGGETIYLIKADEAGADADWALAVYQQAEPRLATWVTE